MPVRTCDQCGTRYRVAESALGKKAKCKKCGHVMLLDAEDNAFNFADEIPSPSHQSSAQATALESSAGGSDGGATAGYRPYDPATDGAVGGGSFAYNLLWTFLFPLSFSNAVNFAVLWGILYFGSFAAFAGIIGLIVQIILAGWFAAYRFAIIESAAAGDDGLPSVAMIGEGWVEGVFLPMFQWAGSWIAVLLPAMVYAGVMASSGDMEALERFFSASPADKSLVYLAEEDPVLALLLAVGYIMWPMVVLCVALGGFSCLYRLDLLVLTIVRTLGIYSLVVLLVFGCEAAKAALEMTVSFRFLGLLAVGITVYFEIVTARVIGLYYHHFKQRFAWDWG